ncbi:MAG: hypothetical protein SP1CHLAM54_11550 [Chlamydiia bacterium]|nr:hypothetical protein [Chlamydiia bacterium]MCH9616058.1 hypothetical protein [Chlamydiia bacterium]MCH9629081.1 hypothetical protein [Chlamydiia bacterium]
MKKVAFAIEGGMLDKSFFHESTLPAYVIPQFYRGLPHLPVGTSFDEHLVPPSFDDVEALNRRLIDRAVLHAYRFVQPQGKMVLLTHVLPDGMGDIAAQMAVAKLLCQTYPELEVKLITLIDRGRTIDVETFGMEHHILHSKEQLANILSDDFIFQMPTFIEGIGNVETLGEYGFLDSTWCHPKSGNRCMGLHALEYGILIKPLPCGHAKRDGSYMAYLKSEEAYALYLGALLHSKNQESKDITVHVSSLKPCLYFIQSKKLPGIREVRLYVKGHMAIYPIQETGKTLHLLELETLSETAFQKQLVGSEPFIGVRGNQSLSEAISSGKCFFYEGEPHTRDLLKDIVALAKARVPKVATYVECFQTKDATVMGECLKDPSLFAGMEELSKIIREEHRANEFVCQIVARGMLLKAHPAIKAEEEKLIKKVLEGSFTVDQFVSELTSSVAASSTKMP